MTEPLQEHSVQDLLAFYDRVNPVLSEWLAKPEWTAEETAMLCAGFIPNGSKKGENAAASDVQELIAGVTPCDPERYLPPDHELCNGYRHLLAGKGAAAPRDMVNMLRPAISCEMSTSQDGGWGEAPSLRVLTIDSLRSLQWLLIIGNAVGLLVPALVPFSLLNGLRDRLSGQSAIIESPTKQKENQHAQTGAVAKPPARQKKPRGRQPLHTTPATRGYFTTEEVAGLMNLLPDTLNKYARQGIAVGGFTPFKRPNGRSWQWRTDPQQALHAASTTDQAMPDSQPLKSLASLLGPKPFTKS